MQELVRRGEAVRILSHRNAPPKEAFADAEIVPTFSLSTYDKVSTDPQWSTMENFVIHNRLFHGESGGGSTLLCSVAHWRGFRWWG